jgi:hypothetical protein
MPTDIGLILALSATAVVILLLFQRVFAQSFQPIDLTVGDLLNFTEDVATSAGQLQKAYDWNISQWSTLGNTLLTATLAFISTCVVELYKESFKRPDLSVVMLAGALISIGLYLKCQLEIHKLKSEFVYFYSILAFMRNV